jgi:uncharacterized protein
MATLIFKATEKCNSNCAYCDVIHKEQKIASMPLDMLELIFIRIDEFLKARPEEHFNVTWHGGEPLLLGSGYFLRAWELQEKRCPETKSRISHAVQSNLTLFSEEFIEPLSRLGIRQMGSSYDPEPHMRGPGPEIDSNLYNRLFMEGTGLAERHGFNWGLIYVVTRKSLARAREIFFFLTNLRLHGGVHFNPVLTYDETRQHLAVTPEEFSDFLGTLLSLWWPHQERYPIVQPFHGLKHNLQENGRSLGCGDSGQCAYSYVSISPEGEASHCGRSSDWGLLKYGNIQDRSLEDIFRDEQREQLLARNEILPRTECQGCRFWTICHGGCPLDAWWKHRSFAHKSEWCEAKRGFIERYFEPITGLTFQPYEQ